MKVWIIIGHLIFGTGPGSDLPVHHGNIAFATFESCESWRKDLKVATETECKELNVTNKIAKR